MKLHLFIFLFFLISFVLSQQCENPQQTQLFFLSNVLYGVVPLSGLINGLACVQNQNNILTFIFSNDALSTVPSLLLSKPFKGHIIYEDFKRIGGIQSNFTSTEINFNQSTGEYTVKITGANL